MIGKISLGLMLLMAARATSAYGDVVAYQGFEGSSNDTWNYTIVAGSDDSKGNVTNTSVSAYYPINSTLVDGTHYYSYTGNSSTGTSPSAASIVFESVSLGHYATAQITIPIASFSSSSGNGADSQDYIAIYVSLDGSSFSDTPLVTLYGYANAKWNFSATGILAATIGEAAVSTSAPYSGNTNSGSQYGQITITIPEGYSTVSLMVVTANNGPSTASSYEIWAIDGVSLTTFTAPEPASVAVLGLCAGGFFLKRRSSN